MRWNRTTFLWLTENGAAKQVPFENVMGKKRIGEWREFYAKLLTIPSIRTDERMGKTVAERWW